MFSVFHWLRAYKQFCVFVGAGAISSGRNTNLQRLLDSVRDISAVFCVKIQIGGNFLVERLFELFTMASARFATFSIQKIEKNRKLAREVFK